MLYINMSLLKCIYVVRCMNFYTSIRVFIRLGLHSSHVERTIADSRGVLDRHPLGRPPPANGRTSARNIQFYFHNIYLIKPPN
jgi:hypothetical protein